MGDLKEEVIKAFADQIHREYAAGMLYRQVYHWFELNLYPGTAKFFRQEAEEEMGHAHILEDYLLKRNANIHLHDIPVNTHKANQWKKPLEIF